jgi:hypothetical protein
MAFLVLFALPVLCVGIGGSTELQHVKSAEFCLSCHNRGLGGLALLGIAEYLLALVRSGSAGA